MVILARQKGGSVRMAVERWVKDPIVASLLCLRAWLGLVRAERRDLSKKRI